MIPKAIATSARANNRWHVGKISSTSFIWFSVFSFERADQSYENSCPFTSTARTSAIAFLQSSVKGNIRGSADGVCSIHMLSMCTHKIN